MLRSLRRNSTAIHSTRSANRPTRCHCLVWSRRPGTCWMAPVRQNVGCYRSEEHTSELQSLMRISYAVFCLKKKNKKTKKVKQDHKHVSTNTLNHTTN